MLRAEGGPDSPVCSPGMTLPDISSLGSPPPGTIETRLRANAAVVLARPEVAPRRSTGESIAAWLAARTKALEKIGRPVRRGLVVPTAWLLVALIAVADFAMGSEVTLRFLYCVPIVLLVAARGTAPAVAMAFVCDLCWMTGDAIAGAKYSSLAVPVLNGLITLSVYLVVIWLLAGLLNLHHDMERRVRERTDALTSEMAERGRLEREIISISEKERWSLGHDLHDGLGQHLTATAMAAQSIARDLEDGKHASVKDAYQLVRLIEDGIGQTRRLAKGLLLVTVEQDELADALREMAVASTKQFRIPCELRLAGIVTTGDAAVATHLFRIAQEAVRNAARHAKAGSVELWVSGDESGIFMAIIDNGVGLPGPEERGFGMGLRIMAHRAKLIGAEFDVRCPPGGGTVVECRWARAEGATK